MRIHRSEFARTPVHHLGKCFHTAGIIARQTSRDIVGAFDEQRSQEIDPLISLARLYVQLHRLSHRIDFLDRNGPIQKAALGYDQSGKQLLRARRSPDLVRVFFVQALTCIRVHHNHRSCAGLWYPVRRVFYRRWGRFSFFFRLCRCPARAVSALPRVLRGELLPGPDGPVVLELELRGAETVKAAFHRSTIRSDERLDYDRVDRIFAGAEPAQEPWATPLAAARSAAAALQAAGLEILGVKDVSPQAHNGVRPSKRRQPPRSRGEQRRIFHPGGPAGAPRRVDQFGGPQPDDAHLGRDLLPQDREAILRDPESGELAACGDPPTAASAKRSGGGGSVIAFRDRSGNVFDVLPRIKKARPSLPVIVMSAKVVDGVLRISARARAWAEGLSIIWACMFTGAT